MQIMERTQSQAVGQVAKALRTELRQFAIGEGLDHTAIESIRGFITFNMNEQHNNLMIQLDNLDQRQCQSIIDRIQRLKNLSRSYFKYFEHYWICYDEGNTLAKYDMISYGESYVITVLEVLRLEGKLFNLTRKDSIVQ